MTSAALELPARRERNSTETKRRLLDAAEEEFAAKGFDGARLGNIARAADVQQALIHHYFDDKAGIYREVIARALTAMTAQGWDILERFAPKKRGKKRMTAAELRAMVEAFARMLVRFYSTHASVLALLRHEAKRGGGFAQATLRATVRPQFDEIVARLDEMRARGEIRKDVHPRHLCISAVAMACFPFQEEHFLAAVWPVETKSSKFLDERTSEIVETILARVLP